MEGGGRNTAEKVPSKRTLFSHIKCLVMDPIKKTIREPAMTQYIHCSSGGPNNTTCRHWLTVGIPQ